MTFTLKDVLIIFIVFQLLVFALVLIAQRKFRQSGHLYLSLFFLSLALNILNYFLFFKAEYLFLTKGVHLFYLGSSFAFSYAPSFFLYIKAITITNYRFSSRFFLHYLPFFILLTYIIITFSVLPINEKREILMHGGIFSSIAFQILTILVHLQVLVYVIFAVSHILKIRRKLKNLYSSVEKLNFSWICSMFAAIICLWSLDLFRFFSLYFSTQLRAFIDTTLFLGFVFFCYFFLYKAFTHRFIVEENDLHTGSKKFSLSSSLRQKYQQCLVSFMMEHKPFLDPEITLVELSQKVGIPPRSLSEVINASFQQNFYDFINSYRIKESEMLFRSIYEKNKTILEVLYEVGFNSKSSFNSAFKKLTGMTPTEYRRIHSFSGETQKQAV